VIREFHWIQGPLENPLDSWIQWIALPNAFFYYYPAGHIQ
jgi:hypothetical protein